MVNPFPDFGRARVLVIGDVMLDRYWRGPCTRISPEAPVPIVRVNDCIERPGGAANVAVNIAALGAGVALLGVVGNDPPGAALETLLNAADIDHQLLQTGTADTVTKLRIISQNQQLIRLDFENGLPGFEPSELLARFQAGLRQADVVVLSDYAKGTLAEPQPFIRAARDAEVPVLIDPKGRDFSRYRGATLLTPNLAELQAAVGAVIGNDTELQQRGQNLLTELELSALLITRSERGVTLLRHSQPALHLAAQAREVYDVTGAGDSVVATLAAALAAGAELDQAVALANAAAGLAVAKLGAASVTVEELQNSFKYNELKIFSSEERLLLRVADARARGARIVFTNGCFDLLHGGHADYLQRARQLGDLLIVAVNDDASVARLKGPRRPIVPLLERLQLLAGLAAVDCLIAFPDDTPIDLICKIKPDFLVKGGDYTTETIIGGREVREAGGKVTVLPYRPGLSTSAIIDRIDQTRARPPSP